MRPLNVICYSDARAGHEKQSTAVLKALEDLTPLSVTFLSLGETSGIKRIKNNLRHFFVALLGYEDEIPIAVDLIIGTGSTTHLPMLGLKFRTAAKAVTCMTPGPLMRPWFDLCLVPRHDRPRPGSNRMATFGPPCLPLRSDLRNAQKGLILAGGVDPKSHQWDTTVFLSQVKTLISKVPKMAWTLSSSLRTPPATVAQLRQLASVNDNASFYSAEQTPRGWIESAYETHAQVWVTADSVSMIYEALSAGCRVGVLPVKWIKSNNKFQNGIDDLKRHEMVTDFEQWLRGVALPSNPKPLNEAHRCAKEILKRWWPDRIGSCRSFLS